jgi:hypothetical protein
MNTKKLYLAIVAAAAAAPAARAMPAAAPHLAPTVVADSGDTVRMSDAARDQVLDTSNILLVKKPRPFTQMGNPWMQQRWVGQMKL